MIKHIFSSFLLLLILIVAPGCVDEMPDEPGNLGFDEGELSEFGLNVVVDDYVVNSSTKAADPDTDADKSATAQEKAIDNIWVFQYNASGDILIKPRYYTTESKSDGKWLVLLKPDVASTFYVVANTGDSSWASTLEDFNTLSKLKAQTIPNPDLIYADETSEFYIPMEGYKENETASYLNDITVEVTRMFAKLVISTKMASEDGYTMTLKSIEVNNIPYSCRVESMSCDDDDTTAEKVKNTDDSDDFKLWTLEAKNTTGTGATEDGGTYSGVTLVKQPNIVVYVPENIQGEVDDADKLSGTDVPERALTIRYALRVDVEADSDHDIDGGYTEATVAVYPGCNNKNNFNVKRNRIYIVTGVFPSYDYFCPTPSSNCLIAEPGKALIFWPYYRTETGGDYDFKDYLDPTVSSLTIDHVQIIWQDKDVIGDNSDRSKVTWSSLTTANVPANEDAYEYIVNNFKIRVETSAEGNALIGAYNSDGEIIWSWHIWVTDNDPGNVGNAIHYTTYDWDEDGIKCNTADPASATRIQGYRVMPCNLGAKEFTPNAGAVTDTYGPLYQWGRKDPFPVMKGTGTISGFADYNNSSSKESGSKSNCGANIQVYDNSNTLITMTSNGYVVEGSTEVFQTVNCLSTSSASDEDTQRQDGLKYSINHPTYFIAAANVSFDSNTNKQNPDIPGKPKDNDYNIRSNYDNNGDWLLGHDDKLWGGLEADLSQKHLKVTNTYTYNWGKGMPTDIDPWMWDNYGKEKTIFDPCPTGWRIPPSDLWLGLTFDGQSIHQATKNYDSYFLPMVNTTDKSWEVDSNHGFYLYLDGWKTGNKTFFPCPGIRLGSGQPMNLNMCGNYACASVSPTIVSSAINDNNRVNCLHVHAQTSPQTGVKNINQLNPFEYQRLFIYKSAAGPVRCVRDRR